MDETTKLEIMLQTLGVSNRLKIIEFIGSAERSVGEIVTYLGLSQPLVSHHLKALRETQILVTTRKGAFVYYRLKDTTLLDLLGAFSELTAGIRDEPVEDSNRMFCCPPMWRKK